FTLTVVTAKVFATHNSAASIIAYLLFILIAIIMYSQFYLLIICRDQQLNAHDIRLCSACLHP
ncbi:MAG: hypothetical protein SO411_06600, partial [Bacteroidaceae bacterium]|nr:hypothetical protein [Bacteroidaceae bacterium]